MLSSSFLQPGRRSCRTSPRNPTRTVGLGLGGKLILSYHALSYKLTMQAMAADREERDFQRKQHLAEAKQQTQTHHAIGHEALVRHRSCTVLKSRYISLLSQNIHWTLHGRFAANHSLHLPLSRVEMKTAYQLIVEESCTSIAHEAEKGRYFALDVHCERTPFSIVGASPAWLRFWSPIPPQPKASMARKLTTLLFAHDSA